MKNFLYSLCIISLISCNSVKSHNQRINNQISVKQLHQDIDFTKKKLEELHPKLYWYISKDSLDRSFQSLKQQIKQPLKPNDFFALLAPEVAKVRQGHLNLSPLSKKYTKKETKALTLQKGILNRFKYCIDDDKRLYILENKDDYLNLKTGTEILEINGETVQSILHRYEPFITSDGFNTTHHKYALARRWPTYFTIEKGILDSIQFKTLYEQKTDIFYAHREKTTLKEQKEDRKKLHDSLHLKENKTLHYNQKTGNFNRELKFLDTDSTIAYMKIRSFSGILSSQFYKKSFKTISDKKAKTLIIDVRDNLGGSLAEINNLYSYLDTDEKTFIKNLEVTRKSSIHKTDYFKNMSLGGKFFGALLYPFVYIGNTISVKKDNVGEYYYKSKYLTDIKKPKEHLFSGPLYVLINGDSFSASSIIAAKLKADNRAILVGEETGGANNGTVAGRYSTQILPHSKLRLPIGIMLIQPNIIFDKSERGVKPDVTIINSIEDIINKNDSEIQYIKNELLPPN